MTDPSDQPAPTTPRPATTQRWKRIVVVAVFALGCAVGGLALLLLEEQQHEVVRAGGECRSIDHTHARWSELLQTYVHEGQVNYEGLARDGLPELDLYLHDLEAVCGDDYAAWGRDQQLAFWINAYNAYTVKLILDHYPVPSIRTIGNLPGAAFRLPTVPVRAVEGAPLSLGDVEHEILRAEFHEPRIHFAIVCASESCPQLWNAAYTATGLDGQLTAAAERFVRDASKNRFDADTQTLRLSSIFNWFRSDFETDERTLTAFVAQYAEPSTARALAHEVRVEFLDYDWSLNGH